MKKNLFKQVALAGMISLLAISCAKEESGNDVLTLPRDKFIGTWHVTSYNTSNPGVPMYWDLVIEPASAAAAEQIVMKNFDQQGSNTTVYADVNGNNLSIPGTTLPTEHVEGTGSLNGATLTLDYIATDAQADTVHATATK